MGIIQIYYSATSNITGQLMSPEVDLTVLPVDSSLICLVIFMKNFDHCRGHFSTRSAGIRQHLPGTDVGVNRSTLRITFLRRDSSCMDYSCTANLDRYNCFSGDNSVTYPGTVRSGLLKGIWHLTEISLDDTVSLHNIHGSHTSWNQYYWSHCAVFIG